MSAQSGSDSQTRRDWLYLGLSALMFCATAIWWTWGWMQDEPSPETAPPMARYQSADVDRDGVVDLNDQCPTLAGTIDN